MTVDTSTLPKPEYKISYDTTPSIAGDSDSSLTVSFDASTNYGTVTAPSTPISINIDNNALGTEWQRQTFDNWPSEVVIEDMIKKYPLITLVLVILLPLTGTGMESVVPPSIEEIGEFFETSRLSLPTTPILLGCARPLGAMKIKIDQLAINAGLNGIAFPSEGIVGYAGEKGLKPSFINACCGVTW